MQAVRPGEELAILAERMARLTNLLQIAEIVRRLPDNASPNAPHTGIHWTIWAVIISFFASIIEDDRNSVNFFRA